MPLKKGQPSQDEHEDRAGILTVTDQQSRFHTEAAEHVPGKEVIVKSLSISIGHKDILKDAEFQLHPGRHYVLTGRNGTGKSTLLKAIANGEISSIPRTLHILLLGQTQDLADGKSDHVVFDKQTVIGHVLNSNKTRQTLLAEAQLLSAGLDNSKDPLTTVRAFREVNHSRLKRMTSDARHIATRRSGARGKKAREVLLEREGQLRASGEAMVSDLTALNAAQLSSETRGAADMLAEIQTSLDLIDSSGAEALARSVLVGLGFSPQSIDSSIANLSGGWRTRCQLACALCQSPDILLLDEPTNYLDLPSIIWLEQYIVGLGTNTTVIVVTHDRTFADGVADELLILRHLTLTRHRGNLSNYELEKIKHIKWMSKMNDAQDRQKKHMEKSIENSAKAAKRTGDDKKLKVVASRKKKLEERMGLEVSAKGTRFKLNRDLAGYHLSNRAAIDVPTFDPPVRLTFPIIPPELRFPGALVAMENVSFTYASPTNSIVQNINLTVHLGERIGICGLNGAGKSTLVKLAMGLLTPTTGSITRHARVRLGFFSQQAVDEFDSITAEQPHLTALTHLIATVDSAAFQEKDARTLLGSLGLQGRTVSDVPIRLLSGGQKVRLALAKILSTPPHLLVLDEVTTHLDADTIEGLILALRTYEGAILLITHDRFFMRCVVQGESLQSVARLYNSSAGADDEYDSDSSDDDSDPTQPGVVYRLNRGKLSKLDGGVEQYERLAAKASSKLR